MKLTTIMGKDPIVQSEKVNGPRLRGFASEILSIHHLLTLESLSHLNMLTFLHLKLPKGGNI